MFDIHRKDTTTVLADAVHTMNVYNFANNLQGTRIMN